MRLVIVVFRAPVRSVALHLVDRGVVEQRRQRIALRLCQCDQVDEWLDQRADRPQRVERAIEPGLVHVAAADHRLHFAVARAGDDHGRLDRVAALAHAGQGLVDRRFGQRLRGGRQRRMDREAGAVELRVRIVLLELAPHQIEKSRKTVTRQARVRRGADRLLARTGIRRFVDQAGIAELRQHDIAPRERAVRILARVVQARPLHHAYQQRDIGRREAAQVATEIELASPQRSRVRPGRPAGRERLR